MTYQLHLGDCLEVLKTLPDASVDAVVTDPPYELGFMGKRWDASGIAYNVALWTEALRVLKPGGHLLAFGGTRTYHRMAVAIEDAGFEIRDSLHWVYGCLSEDTEVLIDGEWVHYSKATEGSLALCYDAKHDTYAWLPIQQLYVYDYDDTAYRIESADTDQIVSRNHRCLVQRNGRWEFAVAEEVAREQEARVPVLEALPSLLDALRVSQPNASSTESLLRVLLGESTTSAPDEEAERAASRAGVNEVCGVRNGSVEAESVDSEGGATDLLSSVQRLDTRRGVGEARAQGPRGMDGNKPRDVSAEDVWSEQSGMEGWGDFQERQGELHRTEVRSMPPGVHGDGEEGRLRHGASASGGNGAGALPDSDGSGSSHRPQHTKQRAVEPHAICHESGSQAVRGEGFTVASLARVTPFHYTGTVWCVKVPTGAFVARRNGKLFVTGNSGFPKSLDVSKAIDKAAGAERIRMLVPTRNGNAERRGEGAQGSTYGDAHGGFRDESAPATDAAKEWEGWGTALKPAHEPVVVARKPLVGTVAANVLEHNTGVLNIDGCRVGMGGQLKWSQPRGMGSENSFADDAWTQARGRPFAEALSSPAGRWPPNLLLSHTPECGEACAEDCAVAEMDRQSGIAKPKPQRAGRMGGNRDGLGMGRGGNAIGVWPEDFGGGASRFFPVFRYQAKASRSERERGLNEGQKASHPTVKPVALMEWLVRLVTPPGGVVLDPFTGSGTTGVAAMQQGFRFVGIEREPEYHAIATARIEHAIKQQPAQMELTPA